MKSKEKRGILCLSRKKEEVIVVETKSGERVEITVLRIDRSRVRLGFKADSSRVRIMRQEIEHATKD